METYFEIAFNILELLNIPVQMEFKDLVLHFIKHLPGLIISLQGYYQEMRRLLQAYMLWESWFISPKLLPELDTLSETVPSYANINRHQYHYNPAIINSRVNSRESG